MTYYYINAFASPADVQPANPGCSGESITVIEKSRSRESLRELIASLVPGDCLVAESFASLSESSGDFLSLMSRLMAVDASFVSRKEDVDTRTGQGQFLLRVCGELIDIDKNLRKQKQRAGIERAKENSKYKGRKPIAVDDSVFDAVVQRWQDGAITARQAMAELNLKPNTFYRRIKERTEDMSRNDVKAAAKAIRQELRDTAREEKAKAKALKEQVAAEAAAVKAEAGKKIDESVSLHQMEREIRHERRSAERAREEEVAELKKVVAAERDSYKGE